MKALVFILLLGLCLGQRGYQQRQIYYDEQDNVCRHGEGSDRIDVIVELDGEIVEREVTLGSTGCRQWAFRCEDKIMPGPRWEYNSDRTTLTFMETSTYYRAYGILIGIIQNSTVETPTKVNGLQRDCAIVGNSEKSHYGGPGYDYKAPEYFVRCRSIAIEQTQGT